MNHFRCSDGTKVTKAFIDRQVRKAKARKIKNQKEEIGYNRCEVCGINANSGVYLDCSHTVSVNDCQNIGHAEKAWDVDNIKIRCRECHKKHDKNMINYKH